MTKMREISEMEATGSIAEIYNEIREFYAAPYVSSLFRHLATYPGLLDWIWEIMHPFMVNGYLQHTGWRLADVEILRPVTPIDRNDFHKLGIDEQEIRKIANVCQTFSRVSPVNLVFSGCLQRLLLKEKIGKTRKGILKCTIPPPLPKMPSMVPWAQLTITQKRCLEVFETKLAGEIFVPGIYRILAAWPGYLEYVTKELGPRLSDKDVLRQCEEIADGIFNSAKEILSFLTVYPSNPPLDEMQMTAVLSAISTYRQTSPQMVGFGTLLFRALPLSET